jgi:hypothetical protein
MVNDRQMTKLMDISPSINVPACAGDVVSVRMTECTIANPYYVNIHLTLVSSTAAFSQVYLNLVRPYIVTQNTSTPGACPELRYTVTSATTALKLYAECLTLSGVANSFVNNGGCSGVVESTYTLSPRSGIACNVARPAGLLIPQAPALNAPPRPNPPPNPPPLPRVYSPPPAPFVPPARSPPPLPAKPPPPSSVTRKPPPPQPVANEPPLYQESPFVASPPPPPAGLKTTCSQLTKDMCKTCKGRLHPGALRVTLKAKVTEKLTVTVCPSRVVRVRVSAFAHRINRGRTHRHGRHHPYVAVLIMLNV